MNADSSDDSQGLLNNSRTPLKLKLSMIHLVAAALLLIITIQTIIIVRLKADSYSQNTSPNRLSLRRTETQTIYKPSKYTSINNTKADKAWSAILAGHGVVAISPSYASQHALPSSVFLPDGTGNKMYIVEAYHAMHCTSVLRAHYTSLDRGIPGNWSRPYAAHCFDALRQYIMCNVDDTLLWTSEERSASYFDVEPGLGISHLGNYREGDGLPVESLR
ncbi:hypothetical protein K491DRAFT_708477 [Lophiostoma macrostomum CBS 122681]|uniref:Uncharacterized protein n=1 Tax=Lophiostoma macrostomum CBS 122681 TaxID=1314788 RepID=A0A6A6SPF9_9PLEO|nr:hypothetical protein K491DRAFT_708477 [Lophiostoma macrostomum CBS 122681]